MGLQTFEAYHVESQKLAKRLNSLITQKGAIAIEDVQQGNGGAEHGRTV